MANGLFECEIHKKKLKFDDGTLIIRHNNVLNHIVLILN